LFFESKTFPSNVVEKIKTHVTINKSFSFRKLCRLRDNVEKYGTTRQVTDHNTKRRMRIARWVIKGTCTHSEYEILRKTAIGTPLNITLPVSLVV